MENKEQTDKAVPAFGTLKDFLRNASKGVIYGGAFLLAAIGATTLAVKEKERGQRDADTVTNIAEADLTYREKEALQICRTGSARPAFVAVASAVNFTGEHGIPLSFSYGLDDNCRAFAIDYAEKWQSMLGRHEMQMSHNYYKAAFDGYMGRVLNEIDSRFHGQPINFSDVQHRMIVLDIVNKTVNIDFDYTSDQRLFNQDHVATPVESLNAGASGQRFSGDCDDFVAAKFMILRALGYPADQFFATVVGPKDQKGFNHMVLMANIQTDHRLKPSYLTLDNNQSEGSLIRPAQDSGYKSHIAFNGQFTYVFPQAALDSFDVDIQRTADTFVSNERTNRQKLGWES